MPEGLCGHHGGHATGYTSGMARASSSLSDVPLFPLETVLFPGGGLELRVFEPRYLALVRECTREGRPFGVCLILDGQEAGMPATPVAVGCLARIIDFFSTEEGLLGIRAEGQRRFRVEQARVRDDGQLRANLSCWPDEPSVEIPAEFGLLETILQRLIEPLAGITTAGHDDASWVSFRLAEALPLDPGERQYLLEMTDPIERLAWLRDVLPRFQRG